MMIKRKLDSAVDESLVDWEIQKSDMTACAYTVKNLVAST